MINILNDNKEIFELIDAMDGMVRIIGTDNTVIMSSKEFNRIFGTDVGDNFFIFIDGMIPDKVLKNIVETGQSHVRQEHIRGRIYSITASPLFDSYKSVIQIVETWRDITGELALRKRLESQNKNLVADVSLARTLQLSLLPTSWPKVDDYYFSAYYHPCDMVGGDFYDIFRIDDDNIVFYIADVAGHGVTAAMLTVFFSQAIRSIMQSAGSDISPGQVLSEVSDRFAQMELSDHLYITAWVGKLNIRTGNFTYCNAGHVVAPLLYDGERISPLEIAGIPICRWVHGVSHKQMNGTLPKGGKLLLYTDGLSDLWRAYGANERNITHDSVRALVRSKLRYSAVDELLGDIWTSLTDGMDLNTLVDDVAMILLSRDK